MEVEDAGCVIKGQQHAPMAPVLISLKPGIEVLLHDCFSCDGFYNLESCGIKEFRDMMDIIFRIFQQLMHVSEVNICITAIMYAMESQLYYSAELGSVCLIIASKLCSDDYLTSYELTRKHRLLFAGLERDILRKIRYKGTRYTFLQYIYDIAAKENIELPSFYEMEKHVIRFCKLYGVVITHPIIGAVLFVMYYRHWLRVAERKKQRRIEQRKIDNLHKDVSAISLVSPLSQTVQTPEDKITVSVPFLPGVWVPGDVTEV